MLHFLQHRLHQNFTLHTHYPGLQMTIFINIVPSMHYAPSIILRWMSIRIHALVSITSEEQTNSAFTNDSRENEENKDLNGTYNLKRRFEMVVLK